MQNDSPSIQSSGQEQSAPNNGSAPHVLEIYSLLGSDAVLLICPVGEKGCRERGWPERTLEETKTAKYQKSLSDSNIAVLLGRPSNGICAIDIDDDERAKEFLAANPKLAGTLRTRGKRGCQIWLRMKGPYPPKVEDIKDKDGQEIGEWRGGGGCSMIYGRHPEGVDYGYLVKKAPVEMSLDKILLPEGWTAPWYKTSYERLVENTGVPFEFGKGGVTLNQHFFARKFAMERELLFDGNAAQFYEYDSTTGLWRTVSEDVLKKRLFEDFVGFANEQEESREKLKIKANNRFLEETLDLVRGYSENSGAFENTWEIPIIHCKNAMVLAVGEGRTIPFLAHFYSRNQCPINYRPDQQCPKFEKWLGEVVDDDDVELLQTVVGYLLLPGNPAQKIFLFPGVSNSGKSELVGLIERLVGTDNIAQLRTAHLGSRFELAGFVGKTLLTGKDVPPGFLLHENAQPLKSLVGGDRLDAELKNCNGRVAVMGRFNVVIASNHRLPLNPTDDPQAWSRRLVVINFVRPYKGKRIPDFQRVLIKQEGEGILAWAIKGASRAYLQLQQYGDLILTEAQRARVQDLAGMSQSLELFVKEMLVAGAGDVTTEEVLQRYRDYCEQHGWSPSSEDRATKRLAELMQSAFNLRVSHSVMRAGQAKRGYRGVIWRHGNAR